MSREEGAPIRILIVDDHPVVRAGLTSMLATYPELDVVGSAADGDQALALIAEKEIDIVLLDLRMPKKNGIQTISALKQLQASARVIVLTSYESDEDIYQSVRAGAQGYLLKASPEKDMIDAIHTVHAGERYLPTDIASRLAERMPRANLTQLQSEILDLIARGITDDQIAAKLRVPNRSIWNQLNLIIETLDSADDRPAETGGKTPKVKITIAEVARKAGVSMSTVSRVLHESGKHTEETRRAVMKVVREYDFQLNETAASLAMMRGGSSEE
jgi:DNA-binding NarL/FixJ family response regulator